MLNKEKYAKEIIEIALSGNTVALKRSTNKLVPCNSMANCRDCGFCHEGIECSLEKLQEWANAEYKDPILDEVEREYLSDVCRPYKVKAICKKSALNREGQCLNIYIDNVILGGYEYIILPYFNANTMYKGMEVGKKYIPQELGIKCRNNPKAEIKHENG